MDCDMLCLGDVTELFRLDLDRHWLRVVKHDHQPTETLKMDGRAQTAFPRKNWSSLMLLNCARLTVWTKANVETRSARWLHRFEPIPDERIGDLPVEWNVLDRYDAKTKLIHYTAGGPWFDGCRDHPFGDLWIRYRDEYLAESPDQDDVAQTADQA
jgi:lipopolysaccharide biosynthesis glycosyltransferase